MFVLVGPFNVHMLDRQSRAVYNKRLAAVSAYLAAAGVPYFVPEPLDSDLYADASHPLAAGYAELARRLYENEAFTRFDGRSIGGPGNTAAPAGARQGETR